MAFDKNKIQELYPEAKMYEAQLIYKGTEQSLKNACSTEDYFGQLKKDGHWYQYENHGEDKSYLFSRTASRVTGLQSEKSANVPHIMTALKDLPKDTILIGEIYFPNGIAKDVTTIMGCLPEKAVSRQLKDTPIHYYIHDILMYDGIDLVLAETGSWDRYRILQKIWEKYDLGRFGFLELAEVWTDNLYSRIGDALASGEEGMVIKHKNGKYEPGKRPQTNLKAKKVDFADVVIIGFEKPTVKYEGKELESWQYWVDPDIEYRNQNMSETYRDPRYPVGCHYNKYIEEETGMFYMPVTKAYYMGWNNSRIKIGLWKDKKIVEIGTIHSGIPDEMKRDMSSYPYSYLNKVCSIQMMEVDKAGGTIRHGFFKLIRPDKNSEECRYEDVFGQK